MCLPQGEAGDGEAEASSSPWSISRGLSLWQAALCFTLMTPSHQTLQCPSPALAKSTPSPPVSERGQRLRRAGAQQKGSHSLLRAYLCKGPATRKCPMETVEEWVGDGGQRTRHKGGLPGARRQGQGWQL